KKIRFPFNIMAPTSMFTVGDYSLSYTLKYASLYELDENVLGITTATTSPLAQQTPSAITSVCTFHFFACISSTVPIAFSGTPSGVGLIKSTASDAVTKRGASIASPGSKPCLRVSAGDGDPLV